MGLNNCIDSDFSFCTSNSRDITNITSCSSYNELNGYHLPLFFIKNDALDMESIGCTLLTITVIGRSPMSKLTISSFAAQRFGRRSVNSVWYWALFVRKERVTKPYICCVTLGYSTTRVSLSFYVGNHLSPAKQELTIDHPGFNNLSLDNN